MPPATPKSRSGEISDIREQLTAYLSRLDVNRTGKIPRATLANLMRKLRMDEDEISAMVQGGSGDGMIDYRRFVAWVTADDAKVGDGARLLFEDVSREVGRVVSQDDGQSKQRDWKLEEVLGLAVGPMLVEALRPTGTAGSSPFADWEWPMMQALGRRGGAISAIKHSLEVNGFVDRLAETLAQCARTVHESGDPPLNFRPAPRLGGQRESRRSLGMSMPNSTDGVGGQPSSITTKTSSSSVSKRGTFVGSYGLLTGFIRLVRNSECFDMTEQEYEELLQAVEQCSKHGVENAVTSEHEHFAGYDDDIVKGMLGSAGIQDNANQATRASLGHRASRDRAQSLDVQIAEAFRDPAEVAEIKEVFSSYYFDQQSRTDFRKDVRSLLWAFQQPTDLLQRYSIRDSYLANWVIAINGLYNANPYHSWNHAFDIFQFNYFSLTRGGANSFFNHQDVLALFIAEIGHDVGHVGMNNLFLKGTGHDLAIVYNDQSPLENMHSAVVFKEMAKEGQQVFKHLSKHDYGNVRDKIITAILATDMAHHFELVDRFSSRVNKEKTDPFHTETKDNRELQKQSKADRRMLLQAFIHAADIGHCARPWDVHKHLVVALEEEMFRQGDKEAELGMPVSPLMNRSADSLAGGQDFFFAKFVMPLLLPYTFFLQDEVGKELIDNLESNGQRWKDRLARHGKQKAVDLIAIAP